MVSAVMAVVHLPASGKKRRRSRSRRKTPQAIAFEAAVQKIQREPVVDKATGKVIRPPRVAESYWRDPDDVRPDTSKKARLVRGWVAADSLVYLKRFNAKITDDHIMAADCYREAWERAHRSPTAVAWDTIPAQTDPRRTPAEAALIAVAAWRRIQRAFMPDERSVLAAVVLERGHISAWAEEWGAHRAYAMGFLIGVLEHLVSYFRSEIDDRRREGLHDPP